MNRQNEKLKVKGEKYKICATDFEGITLVALVITIIVLIILAAVSINAVMNDGLIKNAKEAKNAYDNATKKEQTQLSTLLAEVEHYELPDVVAGGYTGTSNAKYKDSEGALAIIPAGFTVSGIDSENKISKGLVIYSGKVTDWTTDTDADGIIDAQKNNNQYVWIPVDNPSDIYGTLESPVEGIEGTKFGKLYDFGDYRTGYATSPSEATHLNWPTENGYDADEFHEPTVLDESEDNVIGLATEFSNMIASVEKYKGFYIGRYELSSSGVRKGVMPLLDESWRDFYDVCETLESSNTDASGKIVTTMIWGCQWDQAAKMSLTDKEDFLTNFSNYGWFDFDEDSLTTTGKCPSVFNIFDLLGNAQDLTSEGLNDWARVSKGAGAYTFSMSGGLDVRFELDYDSYSYYGCRSQLYIK